MSDLRGLPPRALPSSHRTTPGPQSRSSRGRLSHRSQESPAGDSRPQTPSREGMQQCKPDNSACGCSRCSTSVADLVKVGWQTACLVVGVAQRVDQRSEIHRSAASVARVRRSATAMFEDLPGGNDASRTQFSFFLARCSWKVSARSTQPHEFDGG